MPEFILDHGSPEAARSFNSLDAFTQGYIEAMFFTDASDPDDGDLANATFAELAPKALEKIVSDCVRFQSENRADLDEALDTGRINGYDDAGAGRDFWYTRNGHGVGFWDRKLGDIGEVMSEAARKWGQVDLYRGDDELIYLG
jgi:phage repressor protein C with HTH and peptisase S24 domain